MGLSLVLNGGRVSGSHMVCADDLASGVVLELASRVVLLLHLRGPASADLPDLGLVGRSEPLDRLRADVLRVADLDVPVLLRGETGTGKELVARALHACSTRAAAPFVAVNVAALGGTTAASELFGHATGAFTGAVRDHPGRIRQADGGTLFLDELAEMPLEIQALLLRVLETQEVWPVGGRHAFHVNVRLVTATDADIEGAILAGRFREPLYHRVASYQLEMPPLRARRDDIGRLLHHFLGEELRATGDPDPRTRAAENPWLRADLVARLARYAWPGNVRELRNIARQLVVSSRGLPEVAIDARLASLLDARPTAGGARSPEQRRRGGPELPSEEALIEALRMNGYRTSTAARQLGISRSTLYGLIEKSTRIRKAKDVPPDELSSCYDACEGDLDRISQKLEVSKHGLRMRLAEIGRK